uniref:Adhesion G-protein coupled receptor G1 n=1 Tax=Chelydra serpentina TaxID=8475 RepID=A0A8C3RWT7_CHESE
MENALLLSVFLLSYSTPGSNRLTRVRLESIQRKDRPGLSLRRPGVTCLLSTPYSAVLCNAGVNGSSHHAEDFRFCGERSQTNKSRIIYERKTENMITIENSAEALRISAPFPTPKNCLLPNNLGNYRFCFYWYQSDRIFNLTYGRNNYTLSTEAEPSFDFSNPRPPQNKSGVPVLSNVSYAYGKGLRNTSLSSAAVYSFSIRGTVESTSVMHTGPWPRLDAVRSSAGVKQRSSADADLPQRMFWSVSAASPRAPATLLRDALLGFVLQVGREVHGFEVILPKILFAQARGRRMNAKRVVLIDINSQALFQDQNGSRVLGEKVIGITVGNTPVSDLPQDMVLKFFHDQLPRNVTPQCVFWDVNASYGPGSWKSDGCETEMGSEQTVCRCNHLTYFAVLMISSPGIQSIHKQYLTIITYIGCIISALASLFTIFFFCCCSRRKHRDGTINIYIHMHLLGAIFLLDVSFLITEPLASVGSEAACKAGGMFLHLSLLCCLTWMGIEGYNLYRLVVEVFNTYVEHFILKLCLVGWGLPIFIVGVIFLADQTNYGPFHIEVFESLENSTNATMCWITAPLIHNVVNLGIFSLVFLFNLVMLGAMVREMLRQRKRGHQLKHALVLLGLSLVLGVPWALAFFSFSSGSLRLATLYLFTIINSLQGFLIFLWYWTMVLQVRKSKSYPSPNSTDSARLPFSTSRTSAD